MSDDVCTMAHTLRVSEATMRERVTCLDVATCAAPPLPAVMESITIGLAEALSREPKPEQIASNELDLCEALLRNEIGTDSYVAGRSAVPA